MFQSGGCYQQVEVLQRMPTSKQGLGLLLSPLSSQEVQPLFKKSILYSASTQHNDPQGWNVQDEESSSTNCAYQHSWIWLPQIQVNYDETQHAHKRSVSKYNTGTYSVFVFDEVIIEIA